MGAETSKIHVDEDTAAAELRRQGWYDQPPHTINRSKSKSKSTSQLHPSRSKSLSSKPTYPHTSGVLESAPDPRIQRSFSQRQYHDQIQMPVPQDIRKLVGAPHNPLPVPPKDILSETPKPPPQVPRNQYSRVPSVYPSAFVPMTEGELRKMKKDSKKKGKEKAFPLTKGTAHKPSPSESSTSHSSASTSNPPRQVIIPPMSVTETAPSPDTMLTHKRSRSGTMSMMHEPLVTPMPVAQKKKLKGHKRIIQAILVFLKLKKKKDKEKKKKSRNPPFLPVDPDTLRRSHSIQLHVPASLPPIIPKRNLPPKRPISPPFMLASQTLLHPPPPIAFYHPDDPHYGFTTFSPHTIFYKRELYPTAEHLYQCMKFFPQKGKMGGDEEIASMLRTAHPHPKDVVLEARKLIGRAREDWKEARVVAMDEILYLKYSQHPGLRAELLATHPAELILSSPADPFWGIGKTGHGQNELGRALMRTRDRLRRDLNL